MKVISLGWLGVRTSAFAETRTLYRDVLGLECLSDAPDDARFRLDDGTEVHVYGPSDEEHTFFGAGPVVGLVVDDFAEARARLVAAGIAFVGEVEEDETAFWNHFVGPDGNVYELIGRR